MSINNKLLSCIVLLLFSFSFQGYAQIHVDLSATGSNNGTSWTDAYTDLQVAINAAAPGDQIWVAQGIYLPTISPSGSPDPRTMSFYMNQDILIYGGFDASTGLRNPAVYITTLSGDIGVTGNNFDNSYHVFITASLTSSAVIDGFTIQDGNAEGSASAIFWGGYIFYDYLGGGFYNESSSPTLIDITVSNNSASNGGGGFFNSSSSPTLTYVTVSNNLALIGGGFYNDISSPILTNVVVTNNSADSGGGFFNQMSSSPTLTNVTVTNNSAINHGGGFCNTYYCSPTLTNVTVTNNSASLGGGFFNHESLPTLTNVIVNNNSASDNGGGFYNQLSSIILDNVTVSNNSATNLGGGFHNYYSFPILTDILVSNNSATNGGGFYNTNSSPTLINTTISNNSATNGSAFHNDHSSPVIQNSIIWDNSSAFSSITNIGSSPTYSYSLIQGSTGSGVTWNTTFGTDGGNNIDMNPMFTTAGIDFTLQSNSPAINTGNNSFNTTTTDLAGNTRIQNVTIDMGAYETFINPITISSSVNNVSCFGANNGAINLTVTGGTPPYTYSWSNGSTSQNLSGLSPGTYTVTVTDINGVTSTHTATVTQPAAALAIAHTATKSCSGQSNGTITLTITGGTPTYTYSWNDGSTLQNRTGLAPGIYRVTVTDANGCTKTKSITILSSTPLVIRAAITHVSPCYGGANGTITLTVTGGTSPYTYVWNNGSTSKIRSSLTAGTYPITVTDANGCTMSSTITVTQPSQLIVTTLATNTTGGLNNGSIALTVTGGTSPYTYLWNTTPPATTPTITGLGINAYRVTVTDANGCKKIISKRVNRPAGNGNETEELFEEQLTNLYPNPAKTSFNLEFDNIDKGDVQVEVFTALGTRIYSNTTNLSLLNISTENWEAGFYYVRVMQGDYSQTLKVVVQP